MEEKKKLVYILHDIAIGGVEVALLSAIPDLHKKYNLKIVVLGKIDPKNVSRLTEDEKRVFKVFDYPIHVFLFKIPTIVKYILDFRPDILISSLWRASMVACLVKRANSNIRLIAFNHSTRFSHHFQGVFIKMAARMADLILTDSVATSNFVRTFNAKAPIKEVSFLTEPTPEYTRRELPEPGEPIRFMFLGRINPVKNLPLIVKTIHILRENSVPAMLDIYGRNDGNSEEAIALIEQLNLKDAVNFKGEVESSTRKHLFSQYHFYIQLSSWEGMAMSVAEAMQHGLVCIVSPVGEIVHYAVDMESAIFINIHLPNWQNDVDKAIKIIRDNASYQKLSENCRLSFLHKKLYKESLIDQLENSPNL